MPLYEYECAKDGRFELIRKFSDPPVEQCPTCGQPVEKLLSSPAIQFKGSGWYITDYARKGSTEAGRDSKAADSKGAESKSGDSKPSESKSGDSKAAASSGGSKSESSQSSGAASSGSTSSSATKTS